MTEPSKFFTNALPGGGGANMECQCGILHLCPDNDDYDFDEEPGSWKKYCEKEFKDHPTKVVLSYEYDAVSYKEIDGKAFVYGCTCWDKLANYEEWIWDNRDIIRLYLKERIDHELKMAEQEKIMNILMDTTLAV